MVMICLKLWDSSSQLAWPSNCKSHLSPERLISPYRRFLEEALFVPFEIMGVASPAVRSLIVFEEQFKENVHRYMSNITLKRGCLDESCSYSRRRVRAASVEIHSRNFDVHSATLTVDARFVGLRRLLHERPIASGALGIAITALSMFVLAAVFGRRIMSHAVRLVVTTRNVQVLS